MYMVKHIALLFFAALLGFAAWFSEIYFFDEWRSLHWLHRPIYSAFIGTLLAALMPVYILHRSKNELVLYTLILWLLNCVLYFFGKNVCYSAFGRLGMLFPGGQYGFLLACVSGYFVQASALYFVVRKMGVVLRFYAVGVWTILGLLCFPLSFFSLELLGSPGSDGGLIDAIKTGYPVFWSVVIPGAIAIWIKHSKRLIN